MPRAIEDPILAYTAAEGEINQIQWGVTQPDWIGRIYVITGGWSSFDSVRVAPDSYLAGYLAK